MKTAHNWHPLLFAAFPVLFLYARNAGQFSPGVVLLPLAAAGALALVLWGVGRLLLRTGEKAALLASFALFIFFSYGHGHHLLLGLRLQCGPLVLGPDRVLFPLSMLAVMAVAFALARARRRLAGVNRFAALIGLLLLAGSLLQATWFAFAARTREDSAVADGGALVAEEKPHVIYLILDGYARADVLDGVYGYDNGPFLDALRERGFFVADRSRANYCQTTLSLASSLNCEFLDGLASQVGRAAEDREPLRRRIKRGRVARWLQALGYTYVAFATGYYSTEARGADLFLGPGLSLDEFQNALLDTTPMPSLFKLLGNAYQDDLHRARIAYTLDHLADVCRLPGPAFVLAHIVAPHPPFVFGPRGEPREPSGRFTLADGSDLIGPRGITAADYRARYRDQLTYLNSRLLPALDRLLVDCGRDAIIVLQADHGPGSRLAWEDAARSDMHERMAILNAYHFPDRDYAHLRADITPVNTFRLIFNQYFGGRFGMLPERSFFSTETRPYDFCDVTQRAVRPGPHQGQVPAY